MSNTPNELKYMTTHEWSRVEGNTVTVGISDHAQEAMGDLVYVELPEVGAEVNAHEEAGVVESVKAASDIYAPVTGKIIEINDALTDAPETVNSHPYHDGWMFKIEMTDPSELEALLSADDYIAQVEAEDD
ncbi:MAG: glycine cleavage system protein H [Moraxellaceae bacterium]|nr:MAG: glycine cleavage system protein H [Moraxellaceae bacterium]